VESKRKSRQLYAHFIVRRKVDDRRFVGAGALHCHLLRFKLNLMLFGFADDRPAEILIRTLRSQPIRLPTCAARSRISPRSSMLASSHEAIRQPATPANARTANPRMSFTFPITTTGNSAYWS
jgi:hypothetical protein